MATKKGEFKKRISLGYHLDVKSGKKKQVTKMVTVFAKSQEEANAKFAVERVNLLKRIEELKTKLTMDQLAERYYEIKNNLKESTILSDNYRWKVIQPLIGKTNITDVKASVLESYFKDMENKGYSIGTIHNVYIVVNKYLNLAVEQEWLEKNPMLKLKYTKYASLPDANNDDSTETDVIAFYKFFLGKEAKTPFEMKFRAMLLLAADGCLRVSELMALSWKDIDLDEKSLYIRKAKQDYSKRDSGILGCGSYKIYTPKTKSSVRKVPMMDITVEALKLHKDNCEKYLKDNNLANEQGFLFYQTRNLPDRTKNHGKRKSNTVVFEVSPQKNNTFNQSLMRVAKKNNLSGFRSHKIRKTFYSLRLHKMNDSIFANYILGHGVNRSDQSYILGMYTHAAEKQAKWEGIFKNEVLDSNKDEQDKAQNKTLHTDA